MKPYKDQKINSTQWNRTFDVNTDSSELIWHRDKKTRIVEILQGENWELQLDNQLPIKLIKENKYTIPKMEYHRIIKGKNNLIINIKEL
jgi:hypothetical protein